MKQKRVHAWKVSIGQARLIQNQLKKYLVLDKAFKRIEKVAAVDVSFIGNRAVGAAAVFSFPDLKIIEKKIVFSRPTFPYVPGFLSFREGPIMLKALLRLKTEPDVILFDGQGIAHPREMGEATHLGILLDKPSIGCAKSRLVGEYKDPGRRKGSFSKICFEGKTVGAAVRTREGVKPNFVSPGHRIDLKSAVKIVLACTTKFRIPDPLRFVHTESIEHARKR